MNTNIKISLTDPERNLIARKLDGKNTKRMVSRKEVNELVAGFVEGLLEDLQDEHFDGWGKEFVAPTLAAPDLSQVPAKYRDRSPQFQAGWVRGWNKVKNGRAY